MANYFHAHRGKKLIFNFADLNFISPNVIPNILNIADIYKNFFKDRIISLELSWNPDLLSYLYSMDFFKYSDKLKLFNYNKEMLGGFKTYSHKKNCSLIFSEKNSAEDEIHRKGDYLMRSMEKYNWIEKNNNDINEKLSDIFFHLIHNANEHGFSNAYGVFHINQYKTRNIAYISICDGGEGISSTIWEQFRKDKAKPYFTKNEDDPTYLFIIEALFWRKRIHSIPYRHGLYNVADVVLRKGGKIGIHSDDTYVIFDEDFLETFSLIVNKIDMDARSNTYLHDSPNTLTPYLLDLLEEYKIQKTKTRKYRGVHIDIEIPLGDKK
jgi:hypothetical protein